MRIEITKYGNSKNQFLVAMNLLSFLTQTKGSFSNYVDQILRFFNHPPTSSWHFYLIGLYKWCWHLEKRPPTTNFCQRSFRTTTNSNIKHVKWRNTPKKSWQKLNQPNQRLSYIGLLCKHKFCDHLYNLDNHHPYPCDILSL